MHNENSYFPGLEVAAGRSRNLKAKIDCAEKFFSCFVTGCRSELSRQRKAIMAMAMQEFDSLCAILVIAHNEDGIDDEELLLLILALEEDLVPLRHVLGLRLCLRSVDDSTCKDRFRFNYAKVMELYHALRLPDKMVGPSRVAWTGLHGCSMCINLRHFKTWWPVYGYSTATYVSLTTGDAFAVYGRSLDRKLCEKWVFPWFSRLK